MRIKIEKNVLLQNLQMVAGVINLKNTLPILSNILIEAEKSKLNLTTTDLDIGMLVSIDCNIIEDGSITIPARRLIDIIKELPDKTIDIYTKKNNTIIIENNNITFKILGIPKDEFPKLPPIISKDELVLTQFDFKKMLLMTSFSMSRDETRYVLNGVAFFITKEYIKTAATDGRRLAVKSQPNNTKYKLDKKVIIPAKTVSELVKVLKDLGDVVIGFSKNQIGLKIDNLYIVSRLIEGEYPNYEQVIPPESKNKAKINKELLLSAVKRASLLTTEESQAIKLQLQKDKIIVSKVTPEIGEVNEELAAQYGGEDYSIGFNPAYLLDAFKVIDEDEINIEFSGPEKPAVIKTKNDYIYIVLPMQTV